MNTSGGQRCPDCSGRRNARSTVRSGYFIARATELHGTRYDYTQVQYVDQHTPVTIFCRSHGAFTQRPVNHLSSHTPSNCPHCATDARVVTLTAAWKHRARSQRRDTDTGEYRAA
jgi:hypothetical protein